MSNPLETHWTTVKKILQYLKDTILYGLRMQPTYASRPFYYCPLWYWLCVYVKIV